MACHLVGLIAFISIFGDYKYQILCNALKISHRITDEGKS